MASSYERPDREALERLEPLARRLIEELLALRKRVQRAEAELAEFKSRGGTLAGPELLQVRQRIVDLEKENHDLRRRMAAARDQLGALRSRLAFLESREEGAA
jgi:predicted  nucleic acid-binding Zn-ribbon protein